MTIRLLWRSFKLIPTEQTSERMPDKDPRMSGSGVWAPPLLCCCQSLTGVKPSLSSASSARCMHRSEVTQVPQGVELRNTNVCMPLQ